MTSAKTMLELADELDEAARHKSYWSYDDAQLVMRAAAALRSPAPSVGVDNDVVREALKKAEESFEFIRLKLVHNLEEPERSAFWRAVESRDALRAALTPSRKSDAGIGGRTCMGR